MAKHGANALIRAEADEAAIAGIIADRARVPAGCLLEDELTTLLDLEVRLGRVVVSQVLRTDHDRD